MKKWTTILLAALLVACITGTTFIAGAVAQPDVAIAAISLTAKPGLQSTPEDAQGTTSPGLQPSLKDIQGTKYESAVSKLMAMGIIDGYEDGTYRPQASVSRAEMAAIVARSIDRGCFKVLLDPGFVDIDGHWAARGIAKAYNAGIVKGISQDRFGPELGVTYAQAMTMLLRAIGHSDQSLGGIWPANYLAKAQELGLAKELDVWTADRPATRGDVALMTAPLAQQIHDFWASKAEEKPDEKPRPEDGAGKLAGFSGRAIGMPIAVASVLNEKGEAVDEVEFVMGGETYYLQSRKKGDVAETDFKTAGKYDGALYALTLSDGLVRKIEKADLAGLKRYAELTANAGGVGAFRKIQAHKNQRIDITGTGAAITDFAYAAKKEDISIYEAVFDRTGNIETFRSVTASAIDVNDHVRAWDLSDDYAGVAVVLVLIDKDDAGVATAYGII